MGWLRHGRDEKCIQNVGQEMQREQAILKTLGEIG
jgi:hypothetical protein